jgi:ferritin-like metal-binding protein YciE
MAAKTQAVPVERKAAGNENGAKSKINNLYELFKKELKSAYSGETQLVEALPEFAQAADNEDLEQAINEHLEQTKKHVSRLEKVFERLGISKNEVEKCMNMESLIEGGKKIAQEIDRGPIRDSALIVGAQKIEHHEIAAYGSLCELADVLGEDRIGDLLGRTLEEEEDADKLLTDIAKDVNDEAYELTEQEESVS